MGDTGVHFQCQCCRSPLNIVDLGRSESHAQASGRLPNRHSTVLGASLFGGKVDESFIVLDPSGVRRAPAESAVLGPGSRALEESFVLLAGASSTHRQAHAAEGSQLSADPTLALDDRFTQLQHIFDVASWQTKLDQPLCQECTKRVKEEIEASVAEVEAECAAYEAAISKLEADQTQALSEEDFEAELKAVGAEKAQREAAEAQAALEQAERGLQALQAEAEDLAKQEEQYWQSFNNFQMQLAMHVEDRDVLLNKIDHATAQLDRLKQANIYNDVFHIWYDGPFGTISGFRLGRTSAQPVRWEEINAAWGQAVLLLHTMAQACRLNFSQYRLLPMGSYPRIADRSQTLDLFGPVNRLYCTSFDKAATYFLACIKEFSEVARSKDLREGQNPLELPYAIEGDIVGGFSIKLQSPFKRDAHWTKALKYMLTDLKWCLAWMVGRQERSARAAQQQQPQQQQQQGATSTQLPAAAQN
ncbi:hypothetical protein WJX73_000341 [Symbiochloris irregularis]|uniref:Beclin 1 n=1 Tax=Symbiochloris irregularis TaxID=706552 RepID=A0AAW1PQC2_9CHLO